MRDSIAQKIPAIVLVAASPIVFAQPQGDSAAVFSCAQFPADLSKADLVDAFGSESISDEPVISADNGPVPGTVLFASDPERRIEIAWRDQEVSANPVWVRVTEGATRWRSPHGVSPTMTLRKVEEMNGWPFRLGGFLLERGQGFVRTWGSGRLQQFDDPDCPLRVQFQPRRHADADFSLSGQLTQGTDYSSGHPAMQASNPLIVGLNIYHGW